MTVKDLIKQLESFNQNLEVYCTSNSGVYDFGVVHSVNKQILTIVDGDGFSGDNPKEKTVLVINEQ